MKESEIVTTVRQIAMDAIKHGYSELSKRGATQLLSSSPESGGGVLTHWLHRELDERKKVAVASILTIVARLRDEKLTDLQEAGNKLAVWCDELECGKPTTKSRTQPEHAVTKWVRRYRSKYQSNAQAVREYIERHEGNFSKLSQDLKNDLKKKPLLKPKKPS